MKDQILREIKISYTSQVISVKPVLKSSDFVDLIHDKWDLNTIEIFESAKMVLLNRANKVIGYYNIGTGGTSAVIIDLKLTLSIALKCLASNIILYHNHPSGNLKASAEDIRITKKFQKAAKLVDLNVIDHIIVTKKGHLSMHDSGLM